VAYSLLKDPNRFPRERQWANLRLSGQPALRTAQDDHRKTVRPGKQSAADLIPALTVHTSARIVSASQGGVQFPTGGIPFYDGEPASASGGPEGQQIR